MVAPLRRRKALSPLDQQRVRMIAQTSAFLTAALAEPQSQPRIPRRRVDEGGFAPILQHPGARALADRFWEQVLGD